jgi:hypothetical protein
VRAALLALALSVAGCDLPSGGAWLGAAAAAHRSADEALARGDRPAARAALSAFAEAPRPPGVPPDDRRVVVQDVYFRLSVLALEEGDAAAGLTWADRGLLAGREADVFTANLHVARGKALEAQGDAVAAAVDYLAAQRINERLLERLLERALAPEGGARR